MHFRFSKFQKLINRYNLYGDGFWQKFRIFLFFTPARRIIFAYLFVLTISTILLSLPITWNPDSLNILWGVTDRFIIFTKALFYACSAMSDTGLSSTESIVHTFNVGGQIIIYFLIIFGGLGYVSLKVFIFILIRRKLQLRHLELINQERAANKLGNSVRLIRCALFIFAFFIILFTLILSLYFTFSQTVGNNTYLQDNILDKSYGHPHGYTNQDLHNHFGNSLWVALFSASSAFNNAGFDIFGNYSLEPFYQDYFVQTCFVILIFAGGMGFPVYFDIYEKIRARRRGDYYSFSTFTKLTVSWYFAILFISIFTIFMIEALPSAMYLPHNVDIDPFFNKTNHVPFLWNDNHFTTGEKVGFLLFNLISARNAGFETISPQRFCSTTHGLLLINMWIGAAPCSTGGGIRTTTFAIICLAAVALILGRSKVTFMRATISTSVIIRAAAVFITSLVLLNIVAAFMMHYLFTIDATVQIPNNGYVFNYFDALFETASAFGTTGLSIGISSISNIGVFGTIGMIFLMFVGQLTISGVLILGISKTRDHSEKLFEYPETDVQTG